MSQIPRPTVKSFDEARDIAQEIHEIFHVTKTICDQEKMIKNCRWNIRVERSPEFNAYATKSNQIIVSSGLVDGITFKDELAFVIAHEVAHHLLDHINKKTDAIFVGSILGELLLDDYVSGLFLGSIVNAVNSREYEEKADAIALRDNSKSGYDIQKARFVLMRMAKMVIELHQFLQSHPSGFEKITAFDELARRL